MKNLISGLSIRPPAKAPGQKYAKDDSKFVRVVLHADRDTTIAPCGALVEVFPEQARDGSFAQAGNYFVCGGCGKHHTIVRVYPPIVK